MPRLQIRRSVVRDPHLAIGTLPAHDFERKIDCNAGRTRDRSDFLTIRRQNRPDKTNRDKAQRAVALGAGRWIRKSACGSREETRPAPIQAYRLIKAPMTKQTAAT